MKQSLHDIFIKLGFRVEMLDNPEGYKQGHLIVIDPNGQTPTIKINFYDDSYNDGIFSDWKIVKPVTKEVTV